MLSLMAVQRIMGRVAPTTARIAIFARAAARGVGDRTIQARKDGEESDARQRSGESGGDSHRE